MDNTRTLSWQAILCWLTVLLEGYDMVALGASSLALRHSDTLHITDSRLTVISTITLVGVMIGAVCVTPLADVIGRRKVLIASVATLSVCTLLLPVAPNYQVFAGLRLFAGFGLGACMPTALTAMAEYLPVHRRARANTTTMTGYHFGAVAASLLAIAAAQNWRVVFIGGGVVGLALVGIMLFKLTETGSTGTPETTGPQDHDAEKVTLLDLLRPKFLGRTIAVWISTFMGLLLVYGLNTWLPRLMEAAGYNMSASVTMLLVVNAGGIAGMLLAGYLADTRGVSRTVLVWFGAGAVLLALLSIRITSSVLLDVIIFFAGVFVFSAQVLVYAYVTHSYPDRIRGAALGITSGVGRLGAITGPLFTGVLATAGVAYPWGFYFFAAAAVLGLVAMAAAPAVRRVDESDTHHQPSASHPGAS